MRCSFFALIFLPCHDIAKWPRVTKSAKPFKMNRFARSTGGNGKYCSPFAAICEGRRVWEEGTLRTRWKNWLIWKGAQIVILYILLEDCRPISSIPPSAAFQTWKWYDWRILNCYNINFKRINFQTLSGFQLCAGMVGCHHLNYFYTRPSWILNVWPNHQ